MSGQRCHGDRRSSSCVGRRLFGQRARIGCRPGNARSIVCPDDRIDAHSPGGVGGVPCVVNHHVRLAIGREDSGIMSRPDDLSRYALKNRGAAHGRVIAPGAKRVGRMREPYAVTVAVPRSAGIKAGQSHLTSRDRKGAGVRRRRPLLSRRNTGLPTANLRSLTVAARFKSHMRSPCRISGAVFCPFTEV